LDIAVNIVYLQHHSGLLPVQTKELFQDQTRDVSTLKWSSHDEQTYVDIVGFDETFDEQHREEYTEPKQDRVPQYSPPTPLGFRIVYVFTRCPCEVLWVFLVVNLLIANKRSRRQQRLSLALARGIDSGHGGGAVGRGVSCYL
jgi:hypothetical protein